MHEYSIVQALVERVEAEAAARRATRIERLHVSVGERSGVEPALLASAFELVKTGPLLGGASLELHLVPPLWMCPRCRREIASGAALRCPECDAPARLERGDEILLDRIEMEVSDV